MEYVRGAEYELRRPGRNAGLGRAVPACLSLLGKTIRALASLSPQWEKEN